MKIINHTYISGLALAGKKNFKLSYVETILTFLIVWRAT